jgi:hypothetical protein
MRALEDVEGSAELPHPKVGDQAEDQSDERATGGAEGDLVQQRSVEGKHSREAYRRTAITEE